MEPSDTSTLLMTVNVTFNVPLLTIVVAILTMLLVYAGVIRYQRYRLDRKADATAHLITDYFGNTDLRWWRAASAFSVDCGSLPSSNRLRSSASAIRTSSSRR